MTGNNFVVIIDKEDPARCAVDSNILNTGSKSVIRIDTGDGTKGSEGWRSGLAVNVCIKKGIGAFCGDKNSACVTTTSGRFSISGDVINSAAIYGFDIRGT